jgi:hypothetical protein
MPCVREEKDTIRFFLLFGHEDVLLRVLEHFLGGMFHFIASPF